MELDKRIMPGKRPLNCFDTEQARQFIGKQCYFSDHLCAFNKLLDAYSYVTADMLVSKEKHLYIGELLTVGDSDGSCYEAGINGEAEWFQFCLPCEWVEEEKKEPEYRPYTLTEFLNKFTIGRPIKFKRKSNSDHEHLLMFGGYITYDDGDIEIILGRYSFALMELFKYYEWQDSNGNWQPFGVKEIPEV